jgi:hypothetical protein
VKATVYRCFIKQSTVEAYCGVDVYIRGFLKTAVKFNVRQLSLRQQETPVRTEYGASCCSWKDELDGAKLSVIFRAENMSDQL